MRRRRIAGACGLGVDLLGMGFLSGSLYSAMRFDQRRAVILSKLDDASTRVRARLMLLEHDASRSAAVR